MVGRFGRTLGAWATLGGAWALACQGPSGSPPRPDPAPVQSQVLEDSIDTRLGPPADFVRDIDRAERAASEVQRELGSRLCDALVRERPGDLRALATTDFLGRFITAAPAPASSPAPGFAVTRLRGDGPALGLDDFIDRALTYRRQFAAVARCKLKPVGFKLATATPSWATATLRFELVGRDAAGRRVVDHGEATARVERADEPGAWRLAALSLDQLERATVSGPGFVDVTARVGAALDPGGELVALERALIDRKAVLTVGGLAVLDHDGDGFEDLLVGLAGRGLWLLRNDGAGGFERGPSLLPPPAVGLFTVALELDGEAPPELISTAVTKCTNGQAQLELYAAGPDGVYAPVEPSPLGFAAPCGGFARARFEHVAAADLDRDGHLDLVVSGYSDRDSKGAEFNSFSADDGMRDLLFLGRGGLRFSEEGAARGLTARAYTYASSLHDVNGDGAPDIYAVNDYGRNTLLLNDGHARFKPAPEGPLTRRGNSMGVSVVDLDGDGELDVYVSNMYSSAGNRIIPLVEDALSGDTARELLAMAAGNQLYASAGEDFTRARERGAELGVREAGWAWGHATLDLENDGDLDLYVANGLTSHSDARAPDF